MRRVHGAYCSCFPARITSRDLTRHADCRKDMSRQLKSMEEGMKERHAAEIAAWDSHAAAAAAEKAAGDNEIMEEEL